MWRSIRVIGIFALLLSFYSCSRENKRTFTRCSSGIWKKLLAFTDDEEKKNRDGYIWLSANFLTQNDSVFYDSKNDLRDRYYLKFDTLKNKSDLYREICRLTIGDSVLFLVDTKKFFEQQFQSAVPAFCANDSVVKIYVRLKSFFEAQDFNKIELDLKATEKNEIEAFFGNQLSAQAAQDPSGFYWVEKPKEENTLTYASGEVVVLSYSGGFLNGRIIDRAESFSFSYGTPDQLIKGLNYVIPRLKKGDTTKIILPSHLAFGETGSSNGSVPPFTPMLYKLSIN